MVEVLVVVVVVVVEVGALAEHINPREPVQLPGKRLHFSFGVSCCFCIEVRQKRVSEL